MKKFLSLICLLGAFEANAWVDTSKCPDNFTITYKNIKKLPSSEQIETDWSLKWAYSTITEAPVLEKSFKLITRTSETLCVYSNGVEAAFLQTNNFVDELMVPYNDRAIFRTKIDSFNNKFIVLKNDFMSRAVLGIQWIIAGDSVYQGEELPMAIAETITINVH